MTTTTAADVTATKRRSARWLSPTLILAATLLVLCGLLALPLTLPIGPFYWDLFIYFDAANRIFDGQMPGVDFFAPVGPLGYWLFALGLKAFPNAQPLLLVQWSLFVVTAPLMALVLLDIDRRSRALALALLVPFLVFSILPFNIETYSSYPGVDGYGIYNRQVCHILYVLAAALVFVRGGPALLVVVAASAVALFLTKITGFVAAMMLCLFAFAAGRLAFRAALAAGLLFLAALAALQAATGLVGAYLYDIWQLVALNQDTLLPRFLQAASIHFGAFAAGSLLALALLVLDRHRLIESVRRLVAAPAFRKLPALLDRDAFWVAAAMFAGLFFETQNTGSQAFVFVWPVLLLTLTRVSRFNGRALILVLSLVAATALPSFVTVVERAARSFVGSVHYEALQSANLGSLGAVSQRPEMVDRADMMIETYAKFPQTFEYFADRGQLPSFTLYAEPDFQLTWLKAIDSGVTAIRAYEAANGVRFDTIMSLNFVNPFPWLMHRHATRGIAIGADPFRAVPDPDAATLKAVAETDLVLYPKCPITDANRKLAHIYEPALAGRRLVTLSPCWDGYLRKGL